MPTLGLNVIGTVSGNLGLGVAARQLIELALARGLPVAVYDLDAGLGRGKMDRTFDALCIERIADLPYSINVFVVGMAYVEDQLSRCPPAFFSDDFLNVVLCFWELPVIPQKWIEPLRYVDALVGVSDYMAQTFQVSCPQTPVVSGRLPVSLPTFAPQDLLRFGVPPGATTFVCSMELLSDPSRKNPVAVVDAFIRAVGTADNAFLLLRLNNARDEAGRMHKAVDALMERIAGHPRVLLLTDPMTYPEVLGLYSACDVYVSLHRAEGLGLGIAEAMTLGLPVIATGWSGNMTFMNYSNACPVDYRLVAVRSELPAYQEAGIRRRANWAEPDMEHAVECLRLLFERPDIRAKIGAAAKASMEEFNTLASRGAFLDELQAMLSWRQCVGRLRQRPSVPPPRRPTPPDPIVTRALRKAKRLLRGRS